MQGVATVIASPCELRVDGRPDPITTSRSTARLAWLWAEGGQLPVAVRIEAASTLALLESGAPDIGDVTLVPLDEPWVDLPLPSAPGSPVFWRVRAEGNGTSASSAVQRLWTAPDLQSAARWITHPEWQTGASSHTGSLWFAHEFDVSDDVDAVLLHLSTAGVASVRVNGMGARRRLAPGYSTYRKELPAVSMDVTPLVTLGTNLIEIELAPGMSWVGEHAERYSKLTHRSVGLRLLASIESWTPAGIASTIGTGRGWRTGRGGSYATHWYGGEDFDSDAAQSLGDGVDAVVLQFAEHQIWWPEQPAVEVVERLDAVSISTVDARTAVVDFGVNVAGVVRVAHPASEPSTVTVRPGELLDDTGRVTQWSTGAPIFHRATLGSAASDWSPQFGFNGFRYAEVTREPQWSDELVLTADVLRVADRSVGHFSSSDHFADTLHRVIDRAVQGNMHSVFTDCPHREKLGWLEQLHLCFGAIARNFDVEAHLRDALHQIRSAQQLSGAIANTAPEFADFTGIEYRGDPTAYREDPNWGGAIVLTTWAHFRHYGDRRVLEENWSAIENFLAYLAQREVDGLLEYGLGDWVALDERTSRRLVASHGYWRILDAAAAIARELGLAAAETLLSRARGVRERLITRFGDIPDATQGQLALLVDLQPDDDEAASRSFESLRARIERDGRLTVGENTLPALMAAFTRFDADAELYAHIARTDVPGYGYQVARGVTALAETWTAVAGPEGEGSQNHLMLGMIDDWLLEVVGGLRQHPSSIAWSRVIIEPRMIPPLCDARTRFLSPRGAFAVEWLATGSVRVDVAAGASALVRLPIGSTSRSPGGIGVVDGEKVEFAVGAGSHDFTVPGGSR